jgi:hypothetical protein
MKNDNDITCNGERRVSVYPEKVITRETPLAARVDGSGNFPILKNDAPRANGRNLASLVNKILDDQVKATGTTVEKLKQRVVEQSGVDKTTLEALLAGKIDFPRRHWLVSIAEALDVDVFQLFSAAGWDAEEWQRPATNAAAVQVSDAQGKKMLMDWLRGRGVPRALLSNDSLVTLCVKAELAKALKEPRRPAVSENRVATQSEVCPPPKFLTRPR